jgi:hypothetical protein
MSDWTYEPLIIKLKAALAEAESEAKPKEPTARTAPRILVRSEGRGDSEKDFRRS